MAHEGAVFGDIAHLGCESGEVVLEDVETVGEGAVAHAGECGVLREFIGLGLPVVDLRLKFAYLGFELVDGDVAFLYLALVVGRGLLCFLELACGNAGCGEEGEEQG